MSYVKELMTRIRREMNGAVSGSMRGLDPGSQRKINFGVSLPTIKQICSTYPADADAAAQLRTHDVREWWLAAAYVDTPERIDLESAEELAAGWTGEEEANVYGMELISRSGAALQIAEKWLACGERLRSAAAGRAVAKLAPKISDDQARRFISLTKDEVPTRAIYEHHPALREQIKREGPYGYSWILEEIDRL